MRKSLVGLLAVMLVGCSGPVIDDPVEEVTPEPEPTEVITVLPEPAESPESEPEPVPDEADTEAVEADPAIMAAMSCEPLSAELLDRMRTDFGTPTRSVQVEVGEGLTPGEVWWVVVLDSPADDAYRWEGLRRYLTNAPGVADRGLWIPLPVNGPWHSVRWDTGRLVRGQSALTRALECLDG